MQALADVNKFAVALLAEFFTLRPYPSGMKGYQGGRLGAILGGMGTGKTTLLGQFARTYLSLNVPVIWRLRPRGDIFPTISEDFKVYVHENDNPYFFEQVGRRLLKMDLEYETYTSTIKLVNSIKEGLNAVLAPSATNHEYVPSEKFIEYVKRESPKLDYEDVINIGSAAFWHEFSWALVARRDKGFNSFMFDEMSEWLPLYLPKPLSYLREGTIKLINDFRRVNTNFLYTAHDSRDIDWNLGLSRISYCFYFRGATVRDDHAVKQKEVDKLGEMEYFIAFGSTFGKAPVSPFEKTRVVYVYEDPKAEIPF